MAGPDTVFDLADDDAFHFGVKGEGSGGDTGSQPHKEESLQRLSPIRHESNMPRPAPRLTPFQPLMDADKSLIQISATSAQISGPLTSDL